MKKLVGALALIFALASCTQVKIAYVDVEEVLREYEGSKKAEEEMKTQSEKISNELDQLAIPFQQKVQEYQQNSQSMSASTRQEKEQELMQEQQMIQQRQQIAQQQVQAEGQKMIDQINEDIEAFLASYAKSNGYTYILGTSATTKSVLYGEESLDITEQVLDALNADYDGKEAEAETKPDTGAEEEASKEEPAPVN
jgi:outer membrane protein